MKYKIMIMMAALMALATPLLAQATNAAAAATGGSDWGRLAGVYIAMGIASGGCGIGQGRATASACEALARNPSATAAIRFAWIVGLVLIESLALYTFVISFVVTR
ncbi:MAG: ATP synthase F0 subunit C [Bryobacteraceae bacterium]